MLFNSWAFALFFACVFLLHRRLGLRAQNLLLLGASYFFYGWWDWRFLSLILLSTLVDYFVALGLRERTGPVRRRLLLVSLCTNLGILGFFKYFDFFAESTQAMLHSVGFDAHLPTLRILLPVGISFYTFQTMAYTIDVYRRRLEPCRDFVVFAVYVAFFPQLVAGPIERAQHLLPQFSNARRASPEQLSSGALLVLIGLCRKLLIADTLAPAVDRIFAHSSTLSSSTLLCGAIMFGLQIYGDFAGYSDIARGTSRMLGVELMENFAHPYFAPNITEFWRRWHISLSTWLRDYLYIPLGGNRGSRVATYRNLMLTMILGGLWHGAAWTFVIWGTLHGMALAAHKLWTHARARTRATPRDSGSWRALESLLGWGLTLLVVELAWVFFRADSVSGAWAMLSGIFELRGSFDARDWSTLSWVIGLTIAIDLPQTLRRDHCVILRWPWWIRGLTYASLVLLMLLFAPTIDAPFIYFQF